MCQTHLLGAKPSVQGKASVAASTAAARSSTQAGEPCPGEKHPSLLAPPPCLQHPHPAGLAPPTQAPRGVPSPALFPPPLLPAPSKATASRAGIKSFQHEGNLDFIIPRTYQKKKKNFFFFINKRGRKRRKKKSPACVPGSWTPWGSGTERSPPSCLQQATHAPRDGTAQHAVPPACPATPPEEGPSPWAQVPLQRQNPPGGLQEA